MHNNVNAAVVFFKRIDGPMADKLPGKTAGKGNRYNGLAAVNITDSG